MFIKKKKNRSGTISVVVAEKSKYFYKEHITLGISSEKEVINQLILEGKKWINEYQNKNQFKLDLFEEQAKTKQLETETFDYVLSNISNILLNGTQFIINKVFDKIGFGVIEDEIFRHLVHSRLSYPASKSATVEYVKNYFDKDLNLTKIYRYLDTLNSTQINIIQQISIAHTQSLFNGVLSALFYDVTTLYFESDRGDDLRKTGFSKDGKHKNPQIVLGLLVSQDGYPLAYSIHEGNKFEGHTMLPMITQFVEKHKVENVVVVADSGMMNEDNLLELERLGYKYIIGAKIKNQKQGITKWILEQPKIDKQLVELEIDVEKGRKLLIGYTESRAKKDAYNREKGLRRLEKEYEKGTITKDQINKRGYNKYLEIKDEIKVSINHDKVKEDVVWDGLKGYITNTNLPKESVYDAYHNLWHVEKSFRIVKSTLEIRPMFHFTKKRIEAHITICFVALKVYKELERILKTSNINLSVDKVLNLAKTITTLEIRLPKNEKNQSKTMLMERHQKIKILYDEDFWGTH